MTTTGTSLFDLDFTEIAEEAWERAGREMRSGYDLRTARRSMNLMTIEWANRGLNMWTIEEGSFTLTPGLNTYPLPLDTIDLLDHVIRTGGNSPSIQADLTMLPERFDLTYIDEEGKERRPIAIHRAIYGSLERFIGILIEHHAGKLPAWLAPVQVVVLTISKDHASYAHDVADLLCGAGLRAETDVRNEKIGYKIREQTLQRVPFLLVAGDKAGVAQKRFYKGLIAKADSRFTSHLRALKET